MKVVVLVMNESRGSSNKEIWIFFLKTRYPDHGLTNPGDQSHRRNMEINQSNLKR